ncbi:hypothetical protein [Micromonospora sp. DT233]|uniref:5'-methylthioadenosine/S-adenosylhomocysteine nucleosidase family protein n=1 Tax=Micromonospora sp. DT233 TaxID=3393432 RepID=UPI003CF229CC
MSEHWARNNTGLHVTGGSVQVGGDVNAVQHNHANVRESLASADRRAGRPTDVGILTVLPLEMRAVAEMLSRVPDHRIEQIYGGRTVHRATFAAEGGPLRVVAAQALQPGTHSASSAYRELRQHFAPPLVLLVGIAGGIRPDISVGDVILADEVILYDSRQETEAGPRRRGRTQATAAVLLNRVNDFLVRHGPVVHAGSDESFHVHRGPVGSGNAVVTDEGSAIRSWLTEVHQKTLAVETEAAGVAEAFYEEIAADRALRGWMTVRGISDRADRHKGHADHALAARHAALVVERFLPYLRLVEDAR